MRAGGLRARYLAAADGLHSPIRTAWGCAAGGATPMGHPPARADRTVDGLRRGALGGGGGGVRDAGRRRLRRHRDAQIHARGIRQPPRGVPRSAGADRGHAHGPDRAAGPLRQRVEPHRRRVLLVGDAAGYIDALTGEGMGLAFGAAELAVNCVVRDRPGDYDRQWRR